MLEGIFGIKIEDLRAVAEFSREPQLLKLYEKNKDRKTVRLTGRIKLSGDITQIYDGAARKYNQRELNAADSAYDDPFEPKHMVPVLSGG